MSPLSAMVTLPLLLSSKPAILSSACTHWCIVKKTAAAHTGEATWHASQPCAVKVALLADSWWAGIHACNECECRTGTEICSLSLDMCVLVIAAMVMLY